MTDKIPWADARERALDAADESYRLRKAEEDAEETRRRIREHIQHENTKDLIGDAIKELVTALVKLSDAPMSAHAHVEAAAGKIRTTLNTLL